MAEPGWYPDPDGTPGRFRYWDGRAWTAATNDAPGPASGAAPVAAPAPPPAPTPSPSPAPGGSGPNGRRRRPAALPIALVLLVVLVVVVAAAVFWPRGAGSADQESDSNSTISSYDDGQTQLPSPSPTPTLSPSRRADPTVMPAPTSARPVACDLASPDQDPAPAADGRVHGGPLSFTQLGSPWTAPTATSRVPYSRDSQVQVLVLPERLAWQASAQVGIATFAPFPGGSAATGEMLQCILTSDFYTGVDVRTTENTVTSTTIGGRPATERDVLLRFHHPDLKTTGSRLRFVVVESDPITYYFSAVPMERADLIRQLDGATRSLQLN